MVILLISDEMESNTVVIFLIPLFSDQTLGLFGFLLTTYDNHSKRLFLNSIQTN